MTLSISDKDHKRHSALQCYEIMLTVIMLRVIILSVLMLNVVMLSVVAPRFQPTHLTSKVDGFLVPLTQFLK